MDRFSVTSVPCKQSLKEPCDPKGQRVTLLVQTTGY